MTKLQCESEVGVEEKKKNDNRGRGKKVRIILIILVILVCAYIYFEYIVEKPHDVVYKLINCINEKDITASLEYIDPKYKRLYNTANTILGKISDFNLGDLSNILPFVFEMGYAEGAIDDVRFHIVKINNERITGDTAVVEALIETRDRYGERIDGGLSYFYLQKFNVGWRVVDMK